MEELEEAVNEFTHPFGDVAFVAPIKRRAELPAREPVEYLDAENATTVEPSPDAPKPKFIRSVRLPNWMDLDRDARGPLGGPEPHTSSSAHDDSGEPEPLPKAHQPHATAPADSSFDALLSRHNEQRLERKRIPPSGYVCHRCKVPGHWLINCPAPRGDGGGEASNATSSATGGGGSAGARKAPAPKKKREVEEGEVDEEPSAPTAVAGGKAGAKRAKRAGGAAVGGAGGAKSSIPPPGYVCKACLGTDHWLEQCPKYEEYRAGPPPAGYVCAKCNQAGHWVHNCTTSTGRYREHTARQNASEADSHAKGVVVVGLDAMEIGEEIAENLEEDAPEVIELVCKCVQLIGEAAARELIVQTQQIEDSGGLLTLDGTNRRRTPGGVFFWLVKQREGPANRALLFPPQPPRQPKGKA